MNQVEPYPTADYRHHVRTFFETGAAFCPVASAASIFFARTVPDKLTKRREEWLKELADLVNKLAQESFDVESDEFIDAVLRATRAAEVSGTEVKIEMLTAALRGIAHDQCEPNVLTERMFSLIEALSPEHVLALRQVHKDTRRTTVYKNPSLPIINFLKSSGWKDELTVDAVANQLIEYRLVEADGASGHQAFGRDKLPDWFVQDSYASLSGQYFLRYLEAFDDSKVHTDVTTLIDDD